MSAATLREQIRTWLVELGDDKTPDARKDEILGAAYGVSIAASHLGHTDIAVLAEDIWSPRWKRNGK